MGHEHSHISNNCRNEIHIYFQSSILQISDVAFEITTDQGLKISEEELEEHMNAGSKIKIALKPDSRIRCLMCPPREYIKIPLQGNIYVTIVCNHGSHQELMCNNFMIPKDRSIIALENGIRFAKHGYLWMDEDGTYYK